MNEEVQKLINGKTVKSVLIEDEDSFTISFNDLDKKLCLLAKAECCSESWFEFPQNLSDLIGNEIVSIFKSKEIDMPESNRQDCDDNVEYVIGITDPDEIVPSTNWTKLADTLKELETKLEGEEHELLLKIQKIVADYSSSWNFKFILRNSSNGYYSGWLDVRLDG